MAEPTKEPVRIEAADTFLGEPGPKRDMARLTVLPRQAPAATAPPTPVIVATSKAIDGFDFIPRWFCWGLLGLSALIFFIQFWNYALS